MKPKINFLIKPVTLRFSLWNGTPIYYFCGEAEMQLDGIENMMSVDPQKQEIFDTNLGFLPTCSTVLIQGEKNIIVDPGNFHMGKYGMVEASLREQKLDLNEIDIVISTHSHHDHMASTFLFQNSKLIVGNGELEFARKGYWPEFIDSLTIDRVKEVEYIGDEDGLTEVCNNVYVLYTPGHTPGSISVFVETESDNVAIVGDTAMTKDEYVNRNLSHWYPPSQRDQINNSLDDIEELNPTLIIPGHDSQFEQH